MKVFEINKTQFIEKPIEKVFDFFSKPENLEKITPKYLAFNIISSLPIKMKKGKIIDYTIRLLKFRVHWRTLITSYEPPYLFIDEQIKGPYKFWHHTHTFESKNGGVEITDKVRYAIPFGWLGWILNFFWIRPDLEKIFNYRKDIIQKYFDNINKEDKGESNK